MASGKVAFISGASSGVGLQVSKDLAKAGMSVVLAARRTDKLESAVKEIEAAGGKAIAVTCDVTKPDSLASAFATAETTYGGIDVVFANAGHEGNFFMSPNEETEDEEFSKLMHLNVAAVLAQLKHAVLSFRKRGSGGTFVATSSVAALMNQTGYMALGGMAGKLNSSAIGYCTSKSAVDAIVRGGAGSYAAEGINVYGLNLGAFESEMQQNIEKLMGGPISGFNPILKESAGKPESISKLIVGLVDGSSAWPTGSNIVVDHDATASAKPFYDKFFAPGPPEAFGWPAPDDCKPFFKDVLGKAPYFEAPELPKDGSEYLDKFGIREDLQKAIKQILDERPANPKARLAELLGA